MFTRHTSIVARLALVATTFLSAGCGSELLRTGRAPVYLIIENMSAQAGGTGDSAFLLSDVQVLVDQDINGRTVQVPTIFNDNVTATIGVVAKNPSIATTPMNAVTITRYHVQFRRSDGRNTPGVDVPYGFDGGLGVTITAGDSTGIPF